MSAAGPVTSDGAAVFLPNLMHNNKSLYHVKSSQLQLLYGA